MTRYAIYFAPAADSPWWHAGCKWLGRDPVSGIACPQRPIPHVPPALFEKITSEARRYGFHATLKAPFRLADNCSEQLLLTMAAEFAALQQALTLYDVRIRALKDFLALRPSDFVDELRALAMHCVSYFDSLRAPPTDEELARYRRAGLTARQEFLLKKWGYQYTEEEFRFHMTLTDSLHGAPPEVVEAVRDAAQQCFANAGAAEPLKVDAISIFRQDRPDGWFFPWKRFAFKSDCRPIIGANSGFTMP
jgi:ribose 1,5-bisphosphokinase